MAALEKLGEVIGRKPVEFLIDDLEAHGIALHDPNQSYTLKQFEPVIEQVFDKDGTYLLIEYLKKELESSA